MNSKKSLISLFIGFQLGILLIMVFQSMAPLREGKEIQLELAAKDPRSLFRGNYVELYYSFQTVDLEQIEHNFPNGQQFRYGDKVYLEMQKNGHFWQAVALRKELPEKQETIYLEATVQHHTSYYIDEYPDLVQLDAGISSYFLPKKKALALEKQLLRPQDSTKVWVKAMVSQKGKARIKELIVE